MPREAMLPVIFSPVSRQGLDLLTFLLLPDVMTIVDEVDAQLTQTMEAYMNFMWKVG